MVGVRMSTTGDDGIILLRDNKQKHYGTTTTTTTTTTSSFKKAEEEHPYERIRVQSRSSEQEKGWWLNEVRGIISSFLHNNHIFHIFITTLTLLDTVVVIAMLVLEALQRDGYCIAKFHNNNTATTADDYTHQLQSYETAVKVEHVLHYVSLCILVLFVVEFVVKLFVSGLSFFTHVMEVVDVVVVSVTLVLELVVSGDAVSNTVGLLLLVRLWRVVNIVTSVRETVNMVEVEKVEQLERIVEGLRNEVSRLKKLEEKGQLSGKES